MKTIEKNMTSRIRQLKAITSAEGGEKKTQSNQYEKRRVPSFQCPSGLKNKPLGTASTFLEILNSGKTIA